MTISPNTKKILSALAASVAGALVVAATGTLHWLNTWGHGERVAQIANNAFVAGQGAADKAEQ